MNDSSTPQTLRETTIPCKYQHLHVKTDLIISQRSVATHLGSGGIFTDHFIANILLSLPVKDLKIGEYRT